MQIDSINNIGNKQTFGMALYKPSKLKITKNIGLHSAEQFEQVTPLLEKLAQDVDIKVSIIKAKEFVLKGFKVTVSDIVKNPINKILGMYKKTSFNIYMSEVLGERDDLSQLLISRTIKAKQQL